MNLKSKLAAAGLAFALAGCVAPREIERTPEITPVFSLKGVYDDKRERLMVLSVESNVLTDTYLEMMVQAQYSEILRDVKPEPDCLKSGEYVSICDFLQDNELGEFPQRLLFSFKSQAGGVVVPREVSVPLSNRKIQAYLIERRLSKEFERMNSGSK